MNDDKVLLRVLLTYTKLDGTIEDYWFTSPPIAYEAAMDQIGRRTLNIDNIGVKESEIWIRASHEDHNASE